MPRAASSKRSLRRSPGLRIAAVLVALCARAAAGAEPDTSWIDRTALEAGAVLMTTADRAERPQIVRVRVAARISAPPEAIWNVLKACEIAPEYVPNVVNCRSLEVVDGGTGELFVQTVKPAFFVPSFEHVFRLDYTPYSRIDVHRVSGPIALMEATWWLLPEPAGKILLVYDLSLDPGIPVPRFFVRATLKRDLPRLLEAVRERAERAH